MIAGKALIMSIHIPISDSLVDVLDRVLDKGIVIDAWVRISLQRSTLELNSLTNGNFVLSSAEVYEGYGEHSRKRELLSDLFPYWRKDLWTK
jgi:gas vesicle structural protein